MSFANACVSTPLRSPFRWLMWGFPDLIRFRGRRTGREITMPTRYADRGCDVVILVGKPDTHDVAAQLSDGASPRPADPGPMVHAPRQLRVEAARCMSC